MSARKVAEPALQKGGGGPRVVLRNGGQREGGKDVRGEKEWVASAGQVGTA